ncbi:hypothetical protein Q8A73_023375 [Channa argus]|nr:hypothetical protein Q8A73_023375 [Channa argus]
MNFLFPSRFRIQLQFCLSPSQSVTLLFLFQFLVQLFTRPKPPRYFPLNCHFEFLSHRWWTPLVAGVNPPDFGDPATPVHPPDLKLPDMHLIPTPPLPAEAQHLTSVAGPELVAYPLLEVAPLASLLNQLTKAVIVANYRPGLLPGPGGLQSSSPASCRAPCQTSCPAPGGLPTECADQVSEVVQYIFNLSPSLERVLWKTCVVPVPKTAQLREFNHSRPVALTSYLMKTMERIVLCHLCSQTERAALLKRVDRLRLDSSQLKQLLGNSEVRAKLQNAKMASLLPPVGTEVFRRFTAASIEEIQQRHEAEMNQQQKDKLVEKNLPKPAVHLEDGKPLPFVYGDPPPQLLNTPLEELDPYYQSQKTFIVLGKGNFIHRFNAESSCFLLSPFSQLRTAAIKIHIHSYPL